MTRQALRVLGFAYRLERDVPDDLDQDAETNTWKRTWSLSGWWA